MGKKILIWTVWLMLISLFINVYSLSESLWAQDQESEVVITDEEQGASEPLNDKPKQMTLLQLVQKGGIIGYTIIVLSIIAFGLVIDYALSIQKSKLAPPQDVDQLKKFVKEKKFDSLENYHREHPSFLALVVSAGLAEAKFGYRAMVKAMEDATEAITARLSRKIEHLNIIANIAPMLGLLGTVIGMLRCFNEISQVSGAIEPRQLAGGIFEALVTTCMGLIVAIPSLYFFAIFRNRVDQFVSETAIIAEDLVSHFKEIPSREPRR